MDDKNEDLYFLRGDKIYLREIRASDINVNYYIWMNDPIVTQFLESRFYPNSIESLQEYVKQISNNPCEILLGLFRKIDNKHVGNIKIGNINWIHRVGDMGILIGEKECWGKGYATEAIKIMVDYAFNVLNLHKIIAGCYSPNQGSIKAFQKSGFEIEGTQKKHFFYKGKYIDAILLGVLNTNL